MIYAYLTKDSPLRRVFPDGRFPSTRLTSAPALLGDEFNSQKEECYFLAVQDITPEQLRALARMMVDAGRGTYEDAQTCLSARMNCRSARRTASAPPRP